ncbi:hypothetical protein Ndes2526B_g03958 [Nannochloris sp. 'desiccata']|nr:hypothetical protein KSW81_006066 [Chlorella desiccata (nom. nud.)]KAH7621125.1 hypothetical protein NADE_009174 [Chlorella desiccata (nom. nud.)]
MAVDPPAPVVVHVHDNENEDIEAKKLKSFMKMNITKFSGFTKKDPEEWLYDVENALEIAQITLEATKLSAVKNVLEE